jgi:hypothetical protein
MKRPARRKTQPKRPAVRRVSGEPRSLGPFFLNFLVHVVVPVCAVRGWSDRRFTRRPSMRWARSSIGPRPSHFLQCRSPVKLKHLRLSRVWQEPFPLVLARELFDPVRCEQPPAPFYGPCFFTMTHLSLTWEDHLARPHSCPRTPR